MAATTQISCHECERAMKVPASGVGKKIRCKGCSHAFVIAEPGAVKKKKAPVKKAAVQAKQKPPAKAKKKPTRPIDDDEDEDDGTGYGLTDDEEGYRCPNCANEMESDDAIICINCGYNTQTRTRAETKRVYDTTGGDKFMWLLPGIICAVSALLLLGYGLFHHFGLPKMIWSNWEELSAELKRGEVVGKVEGWYAFFFHPGIELWMFIMIAFADF